MLTGALLVLGASWLLTAARLTAPHYVADGAGRLQRTIHPAARDDWWQLGVAPLAALVVVGVAVWLCGWRRASRSFVLAVAVGLIMLQIHGGFRPGYADGDVPRDMLIYNTTSPDVTRMLSDLERLSYEVTGDRSLPIQYGGEIDWPLYWYLRDFDGSFLRRTVQPGADVPVIILASQRTREIPEPEAEVARPLLRAGYTEQTYVLRWHEPESAIYRNFAVAPEIPPESSAWGEADRPHGPLAILGSIRDSLLTATTPEGQQRLWRIVYYRELPTPPITYTYSLFVRNDLVPVWTTIHYGP